MTEWKSFNDSELPELDRPYHITYGSDEVQNSSVYRTHREPGTILPYLQRQEGSEWKDVSWPNAGWIVRYCKWRYATTTTTESSSPSPKDGNTP